MSILRVGTKLEIIDATEFYALPILYTGKVAESGSQKTSWEKVFISPLRRMQSDENARHREAVKRYQAELEQWKSADKKERGRKPTEPKVRNFYTIDVTREAIALIQANQPDRGFLGHLDELSMVVGGQNQYRNGRGTDREALLSGRDGSPIKVNRASGKRIEADVSAYSITGSTHPGTLKKMMGDMTGETGQWARFLWCILQNLPSPYPIDAQPDGVEELIHDTYLRADSLPAQTYKMSEAAKWLYIDWYNELGDLKMTEPKGAMRSVYSKMRGDTGVLALLIHVTNHCAKSGGEISIEVSRETMQAAIDLAKFCISQVKLIHAMGEESQGEITPLTRVR